MSLDMNRFKRAKAIAVLLVLILTISLLATTVAAHSEPATLFLRAKTTEDVKINLDWEITNVSGVVEYEIYWQADEEFDGVPSRDPDATTTERKYTVKDLIRQKTYNFLVSAVDSSGDSLAYGEDSNTPAEWRDAGVLKKVNYWRLMALASIVTAIFCYVVWMIPKWAKIEKESGGA
jgi:hypothetical protein